MLIRISLVVASLIGGALSGGWTGLLYVFIVVGLLGFLFPYRPKDSEAVSEAVGSRVKPARRQDPYEYVQAKRGERIAYSGSHRDPTRPRS